MAQGSGARTGPSNPQAQLYRARVHLRAGAVAHRHAGPRRERGAAMSAEVEKLRDDLAFAMQGNRMPEAEAVVMTTQATVRGVLLEIERLRDRVKNPQFYKVPKLTAAQKKLSPVPVVPWRDYGRSRLG